jgi:hypothetical protein
MENWLRCHKSHHPTFFPSINSILSLESSASPACRRPSTLVVPSYLHRGFASIHLTSFYSSSELTFFLLGDLRSLEIPCPSVTRLFCVLPGRPNALIVFAPAGSSLRKGITHHILSSALSTSLILPFVIFQHFIPSDVEKAVCKR